MEYGRAAMAVQVDPLAEDLLRRAVAAMQRCATAQEASFVLLETVAAAGGRVVSARPMDERLLPLDLTLGTAPPLLAETDAASIARLRLEQILPVVADVWALRAEGVGGRTTRRDPADLPQPLQPPEELQKAIAAALPRFLALLSTGDRARAMEEVLDLHDAGVPARLLATDLISGAQIEIGRRWLAGLWSTMQEHRATSISRAVLLALSTREQPPGMRPPAGERPTLVMACAEGEWHTLPGEIVGHILTWEGWDVTFLGPSLPATHLAAYVREHATAAVALSCSLADRLPGVLAGIEAAHRTDTPCLVGGTGLGVDGRRAIVLGAAGWARDIDGAIEVLTRWREGAPPALEPARVDRTAFDLQAVRDETIAATREILWAADLDPGPVTSVVSHLGSVLDHTVSAQLVDDALVLEDLVRSLSRQVGNAALPALRLGMEAMAEISGEAHPAAGALLSEAALVVDQPA